MSVLDRRLMSVSAFGSQSNICYVRYSEHSQIVELYRSHMERTMELIILIAKVPNTEKCKFYELYWEFRNESQDIWRY